MSEEKTSFTDIASDEQFKSRADSIFGCLDSLEVKHKETLNQFESVPDEKIESEIEPGRSSNYDRRRSGSDGADSGGNRRNESNRKRLPKKVPDHVLNPNKWKKYRYVLQ